jgi:hypothetical protein
MARAVRARAVAGVRPPLVEVKSVTCEKVGFSSTAGETSVLYDCRASTSSGTRWLSCSQESRGASDYVCADTGPPPGTHVLTTRKERAAPKSLTWKCFDVDEAGHLVGAIYVSIPGRPAPAETLAGSYTRKQAEQVAARYKTDLTIDCP